MSAAELIRTMRSALADAGLRRNEKNGSVYWSGGQAHSPVLVLLHGTNDQAGTWSRVVPMLIHEYRLIIPDLAGHGESEPESGPIPISLVVDRLHEILEHEESIIVAGTRSAGGSHCSTRSHIRSR